MAALAIGLAVALANPAAPSLAQAPAERTVSLNAGQVLAVADRAGRQGDIVTAEKAYRALASDSDPEVRAEALFRHGMLLAQVGELQKAARLFRQLLDSRPDATRARLELARTLDLMGDKDAAWREVRAVQASGLPPDVARMVDRYSEALRAARPFGASFQIALAPDSNINKSTQSDTLGTIFGEFEIDESSKAKSGVGLSLSWAGLSPASDREWKPQPARPGKRARRPLSPFELQRHRARSCGGPRASARQQPP
jgi:tetratricopeptide (TPR) repeat protein